MTLDRYGMPQYDKKFGTLTWGKDLVPAYLWYDGTRNASLAGDKIDPSTTVILNAPVGEKRNPAARIFPFQVHDGGPALRHGEQHPGHAEAPRRLSGSLSIGPRRLPTG